MEEHQQPSPPLPEDYMDDLDEVPEPSGSRPKRNIQLPLRFADMDMSSREFGPGLPHLPVYKTWKQQKEEDEAAEAARQANLPTPTPPPQPATPVELQTVQTEEDEFGRYRIYRKRPDHEPENLPQPEHNDFATETHQGNTEDLASGLRMPIPSFSDLQGLLGLFLNSSIALLIQWFYSGSSTKSLADVQHLIDDVILHEDFQAEDLQGVNFAREVKRLDTFESSLEGKGWKESSVKIKVPCPGYKQDEADAEEFEVTGVLHRDLVDIIKLACQDPDTLSSFHTTPFEEMWKPSEDAEPIRLYGEAYTSDEMISAYEEVQNLPPDPENPNVENIVAEILVYSDATRLAQFGTASAHPTYFFFGNLSKYIRCQPGSHAAHHGAYFPEVSFNLFFNFLFSTDLI